MSWGDGKTPCNVEYNYAWRQEIDERDDEAALYREAEAEEVRCALTLFRSLRDDFNQYRAVKVDGTFNWTITKPRSPEALLAALETDEPTSPLVAAQPLIKRLNNWERFWTNRYRHSPPDGKRIEVRVGDLRNLRQALASGDVASALYAALSDIMENPLFQTGIGGNPNMVEALMARANAALNTYRAASAIDARQRPDTEEWLDPKGESATRQGDAQTPLAIPIARGP